jgi:uncharacterized protein
MDNPSIPQAAPPLPQAPPAQPRSESNDKLLAVLCHVSFFIGVGFILPLIVYLVKRDDSVFVAAHAREVLNFHISLFIYCICTIPLLFILIGFPIYFGLGVMAFICAIIGAVRAADGTYYYYPLTIRFF